jgi:hypothetical protein
MLTKTVFTGLLCAGLLHSLPVFGQDDYPWADVAVPQTLYSSPLAGYQRHSPQPPQTPGNWREANDTVARIGGWQAYAAEVWEASQNGDGDQPAEESPRPHHNH